MAGHSNVSLYNEMQPNLDFLFHFCYSGTWLNFLLKVKLNFPFLKTIVQRFTRFNDVCQMTKCNLCKITGQGAAACQNMLDIEGISESAHMNYSTIYIQYIICFYVF